MKKWTDAQINPKSLQEISHTMDIKAMADTGAQCSIFTFGAIRSMGVEPLGLKQSDVSIVGVGEDDWLDVPARGRVISDLKI